MLASFHASPFYCWRIAWADGLVIFEDSSTASVINWHRPVCNTHIDTLTKTQNATYADGTVSLPTLNYLPFKNSGSGPLHFTLSFREAPNPVSLCFAPSVRTLAPGSFIFFQLWMCTRWRVRERREERIKKKSKDLPSDTHISLLANFLDPKTSQGQRLIKLSVRIHSYVP